MFWNDITEIKEFLKGMVRHIDAIQLKNGEEFKYIHRQLNSINNHSFPSVQHSVLSEDSDGKEESVRIGDIWEKVCNLEDMMERIEADFGNQEQKFNEMLSEFKACIVMSKVLLKVKKEPKILKKKVKQEKKAPKVKKVIENIQD